MPNATDAVKQAIRAKFPGRDDLEVIKHPKYDDECIARPPAAAEWRMFIAKRGNAAEAALANEFLVDACVLWPEKAERDTLFERRPALLDVWAGEIGEMAGATLRATRSKL